jgi:hypothetical protein
MSHTTHSETVSRFLVSISFNWCNFYSWVNRTEEIEKDGKTVKVSKTIQEEQQLNVGQLITDTTEQLKKKFTRHVFNIRHASLQL